MTPVPAISLSAVTKEYRLYGGPVAQALGYMGIGRKHGPTTIALNNTNLVIDHGEKVGVIGRNGSGKTTLLRLVIGHTQPTSGVVAVDGSVQAMMQTGFGFSDYLTGFENIQNALIYSNLPDEMLSEMTADIEDFVELGEFLHHPLSTYSLGMRARLEFATATAIRPDILAIDEVLGAGDGYFVQKCAQRMRRVIADSTLLLVSHSLDQIEEYCDRALWIDGGMIVDDGPVHTVIGDYQRFMSRHEATVQETIRDKEEGRLEHGDDLDGKARIAAAKAQALFPNKDAQSLEIVSCSFPEGMRRSIHTGGALEVVIDARATRFIRAEPTLLGFTEHGAYVFEAVGRAEHIEGIHRFKLSHSRVGIGVGNYLLVPALREVGGSVQITGSHALVLRMMATNWSDPPLVHLDGAWFGPGGTVLEPKVSAWV